jgi:GTP-binding protein LepA
MNNIRNFSIIAHIDHGKSTLADRFLEITKTISTRDLKDQTLDSMELEREKGITIKLKSVRMDYSYGNSDYILNLIDTPGHVDFSYEVSRSLAACEGALLVVDASQGIEAQTVSNVYKAIENDLTIIPVLNKVDLPNANVEKIANDLVKTFGFKREEILEVSAKTGVGVENLLVEIIKRVPPPEGDIEAPFKGLVFDTFYNEFLGVIASVRVYNGELTPNFFKKREKIFLCASKQSAVPEECGYYNPGMKKSNSIKAGEVGYVVTGFRDITSVRVGDTITCLSYKDTITPLEGYREIKPFVFISLYPIENDKFSAFRTALEKLSLSDSALSYEPENNTALGFGFRCGFLGLLHAEIVQERLEREYNLELISTIPSVNYNVTLTSGEKVDVKVPSDLPEVTSISKIYEPWISLNIVTPDEYTGAIIQLCEKRRGLMKKMEYSSEERVFFIYELPLSELIYNFFDDLKSISSGFASLDYELIGYREVDAVKLDILVHGDVIDPLSQIVIREKARDFGKRVLVKLKEVLPRQQYKVALQAAIGGKIIAREDIPAVRKDVLSGIYGGHRERKDKLLNRQKKGKKRMKQFGKVTIPQEAFRQVLRDD